MLVEFPRGRPVLAAHTVLLVHGAGGSRRQWEPFVSHLPPEFRPVLVDLPGHGDSSGTVSESVAHAVGLLEELIDRWELPTPLWCIGHSAGGLLALGLALRVPERVAGVCLLASAACLRLHPDFVEQARRGHFDYALASGGFARSELTHYHELVHRDLCRMRLGASSMFDAGELDQRGQLKNLKVPLLAIGAESDRIVSPRHSRALANGVSRGTCVTMSNVGHYLLLESPKEVVAAWNGWASEL